MVHKRYIIKDGKKYGPYFYKTYRDKDGKVRNIYVGTPEEAKEKGYKDVVQKGISPRFLPFVLVILCLMTILSLRSYTGYTVYVENFTVTSNDIEVDYKLTMNYKGYNLKIKEFENIKEPVEIDGIKDLPSKINLKISDSNDKGVRTQVLALNEDLDIEEAKIKLKKKDFVGSILYCKDFNFSSFTCKNWEKAKIPLIDHGDYIEFTVTHFSAFAGGSGNQSNLTIWDNAEPSDGTDKRVNDQIYFYANYTNSSSGIPINKTATFSDFCNITFNLTSGVWQSEINMTFNSATLQYEYNRTFNVKGLFYFNVTCKDDIYSYDNLSISDTFRVNNTPPSTVAANLPDLTCTEDLDCYYNFSVNVTDPDTNDIINYTHEDLTDTILEHAFYMNSSTGVVNFTCLNESCCGGVNVVLIAKDTDQKQDSSGMNIIMNAVNDTPILAPVGVIAIYEDINYERIINATDEENDPLYFWANDTLLNLSSSGSLAIDATNAQVGAHWVNISVNDSYGNVDSELINLTIYNTNDAPILDYICNNQNATEDINFNCTVNATDEDLNYGDTLTFSNNESAWFEMNSSGWINVTLNDSYVGNHTINITVTDASNAMDSTIINFTVFNVHDTPVLSAIGNQTAYVNLTFSYTVSGDDEDLDIPETFDYIRYWDNTTLFDIDSTTGIISFTPNDSHLGGLNSKTYWINITINDSTGRMDSEVFNLTIYINNPPVLTANVNYNATEDIEFYYNLSQNATDLDGDPLTFSDNTTLFDINSSTGEINFTANDSHVGIHWVNITITDPPGAKDSQVINFTVYNVNETPYFNLIENISINEEQAINLNFSLNVTDEDLRVPETVEFINYSVNTSCTLFVINSATGIVNFTVNYDNQTGYFAINLTVNDSTGRSNSTYFYINITAVNDAPILDYISNQSIEQGYEWTYDANASDEEDGGEDTGNLTFWLNTSLVTINSTTGVMNFTPSVSHAGNMYHINISVNDSNGTTTSQLFNITVRELNVAPVIIDGLSAPSNRNASENGSLSLSVWLTDSNNDSITYNWTMDGSINRTFSEGGSADGISDTFTYQFNFTDEGEHNLTVYVIDEYRLSDYYYWNISVNHTNAPPTFSGPIPNQTWSGTDSASTSFDLDDYFNDIDQDDATYNISMNFTWVQMDENYSVLASPVIIVSVNNNTHIATFTSTATALETIKFIANDSQYNVTSNNVTLNVTVTASTPTTVTGGGGGGGAARRITTLDIIHPGMVSMLVGEKIITPLSVKNTGQVSLYNIALSATTNATDIELDLSKKLITSLAMNEEENLDLIIVTSNRTEPGAKEIIVRADVGTPSFSDSVKFFISVIEFGLEEKKKIVEKIVYLKELLNQNPECLELQELIDRAEEELNKKNFNDAMALTTEAVQACKDIVAAISEKRLEKPKAILTTRNIIILSIYLVVFLLISYFIYEYYRKRRIRI